MQEWGVDRLATRTQAVARTIVKTHDLLGPLDSDVEHPITLREPFRCRFSRPCRQRLSIGAKDRRHFGIGNASRLAVAVDDPPTKP